MIDDDYYGDVVYAVYRRGYDSDMIDRDRVMSNRFDGMSADEAASVEVRRQHHPNPALQWYEFAREQIGPEPSDHDYCTMYGHGLCASIDSYLHANADGQLTTCLCGAREYSREELCAMVDDPDPLD